ncbi:DNA/RNA helicase domain-containing protein [Elusimicrobiota bacterium]
MRLFEGTISEFSENVRRNVLADRLASRFFDYYRREVGQGEHRSWQQSLNYLKNSFEESKLEENQLIIEYELPYSSRRIDAMVFGQNSNDRDSIVLIELKQWSNENVRDCKADGNINVDYGRFAKEVAHPSLQVEGYHYDLKDFLGVFEDKNPPSLDSIAFCHNYARLKDPRVLFEPKFKEILKKFPVFAKEDSASLGKFLRERLANGPGLEAFNRLINSPIRPSKRLLEHTGEMVNNRQIFTLIDDQIAAYNAIMHRAKRLAKSKKKSTVIVKGGPGTGKSVIALEVMGELLRQKKSVIHATGSSAFTNTLRKIVGPRARGLFKFFNSFMDGQPDAFDVLVADEAHRIRENSNNRYTPKHKRSKAPQIDELFKIARLAIFFIDEQQIVRPNEVGSIQLIKDGAARFGINPNDIAEFELKTQFRCSGSDAYLQWLDHIMGLRETDSLRFDPRMEFRIFDNPSSMMDEIRARNREKKNSARIAAGFCWPWSNPNRDGSLVHDVKIGDFEMPWEKKDQFWKWATDDTGMEQVGTVYTAQGFEFDYIGVIFGRDLRYDHKEKAWKVAPEHSHDTQVKRANPRLIEHLKSVYRVLLSRAHKGVYVHFMDESTRKYFEEYLTPETHEESVAISQPSSTELEILNDIPIASRFKTHLPVYSLAAAAGGFSEAQEVEPLGWSKVATGQALRKGMFIAQVKGKSMEPTIKDGSYCIFRLESGGSRNGKAVLIQSNKVEDPENGGKYTVKRYFSEKTNFPDGTWRHKRITLSPDNREYPDIILEDIDPAEFIVVAEFVQQL